MPSVSNIKTAGVDANAFTLLARRFIESIAPGSFKAFVGDLQAAGLSQETVFQNAAGTLSALIGEGDKSGALARSASLWSTPSAIMKNSKVGRGDILGSLLSALSVLSRPVAQKWAVAWFKNDISGKVEIYGRQK